MQVNFKESKKASPFPLSKVGRYRIYGYVYYYGFNQYSSLFYLPMYETILAYGFLKSRRGMKRGIK